jgi:hypothetical protein
MPRVDDHEYREQIWESVLRNTEDHFDILARPIAHLAELLNISYGGTSRSSPKLSSWVGSSESN